MQCLFINVKSNCLNYYIASLKKKTVSRVLEFKTSIKPAVMMDMLLAKSLLIYYDVLQLCLEIFFKYTVLNMVYACTI